MPCNLAALFAAQSAGLRGELVLIGREGLRVCCGGFLRPVALQCKGFHA